MGQYARKECSRCHIVLPANEMFQRSGTVVSGRSESTSQKVGTPNHQYYSPVNTTTTHYRTTTYWLCWPCEQQRRRKVRRLIITCVVIFGALLGLSVVGSVSRRRQLPRPSSAPFAAARASNDTATTLLDGQDTAMEAAPPAEDRTEKAIQSTAEDADTLIDQLPSMLNGDIQKALNKNSTRLWHMNGMRGYVVLSDDSADAGGECKNVIVTLIAAQEQRQGAVHKWCRSPDRSGWLRR